MEKSPNLDKIINSFIEKYGEEEIYTKNLYTKVSDWLKNTDDSEIKLILIDLLSDFRFYSKIEIKQILHKQLIESLKIVNIDTTNIIPLITKDGRANSSSDLIHLLKELDKEHDLELYRDTIINDVKYIKEDITDVILFDDISGTGNTIINYFKENTDSFLGKNIILNLISITNTAKDALNGFFENNNLTVELRFEHEYEKVFINHPRLNDDHLNILKDFEKEIWGKDGNILGYNDSQLLVGFSHNIPNNTISSFWYHPDFNGKIQNWNTLFRRYTKKKRPKQNRQIAKRRG
ncbi:hypothetical protein ACFYKX_13180 [Cytobacillus sp. FJAT-54145]|uniref:PRTase-CE domain-containing protein n=1 Tax=Cytobacillus spartinae TaxID=3299023 RepID=A0ABW6KBH7_9BACI